MPVIYVAGDTTRDQYVYLGGVRELSVNLREAWVHKGNVASYVIPGAAGAVTESLVKLPSRFGRSRLTRDDVVSSDHALPASLANAQAANLFLLKADKARWSISQYIVTGQETARDRIKEFLKAENAVFQPEAGKPLVIVDFNMGWVDHHKAQLLGIMSGRPTIIRTDDPTLETWVELRRKASGDQPWIWFSPLQDLKNGHLLVVQTWPGIQSNLVEYLREDATLWDGSKWKQSIVVQLENEGILVLAAGADNDGDLFVAAQSQIGTMRRDNLRDVVGSGVLMVTALAQGLIHWCEQDRKPDLAALLNDQARWGLQNLRTLLQTGYTGEPPTSSPTELYPNELTVQPQNKVDVQKWVHVPADYAAAERLFIGNEDAFRAGTVFRLGELVTADQEYAGALLGLHSRLEGYVANLEEKKKVLSFAIFGGPGSGKSFLAKQLIAVLDPERKKFKELSFNISQLPGPEHLTQVFREIEQVGVQGRIPLVLFDEFDCKLQGNERGWLAQFLMPMQDCEYFDAGTPRKLPEKCVFMFVGGTFPNGIEFTKWALETEGARQAKGRDFHSRLDRCIDIPSIDLGDVGKPLPKLSEPNVARLARAIQLRHWFKDKYKQVQQIEKRVLVWLLHAHLAHGTRSLELILKASHLGRTNWFGANHLPTPQALRIHVRDLPPGDFSPTELLAQFMVQMGVKDGRQRLTLQRG